MRRSGPSGLGLFSIEGTVRMDGCDLQLLAILVLHDVAHSVSASHRCCGFTAHALTTKYHLVGTVQTYEASTHPSQSLSRDSWVTHQVATLCLQSTPCL